VPWKQPDFWTRQSPISPRDIQKPRRRHGVAVLAALAGLDPNDPAGAVDVRDLQPRRFGRSRPRGIGRGQRGAVANTRNRFPESRGLVRAWGIRPGNSGRPRVTAKKKRKARTAWFGPAQDTRRETETDQMGQLAIAENMLTKAYKILLVSPRTDANPRPAVEEAEKAGVPVINVNDAVIPGAKNYIGNVQKDNGVRAARWFIKNHPEGGKLAVIEGMAGVHAAVQRTAGFKETIAKEGPKFTVVASVPGNWDRQLSYDDATNIIQKTPDVVGFYRNNDGMALGVVEAVKAAGKLKQINIMDAIFITVAQKGDQAAEASLTRTMAAVSSTRRA
jgi:hypothetical protein